MPEDPRAEAACLLRWRDVQSEAELYKGLLRKLSFLVDPSDYLWRLLGPRVRFLCEEDGRLQSATIGIPFGTSVACLLANIYLTELDRQIESVPELRYFRYADDLLLLSPSRERAESTAQGLELLLADLRLKTRASRRANLRPDNGAAADPEFTATRSFGLWGFP